MTDQYHHGASVAEINEGTRAIRTISSAGIGLVATASGFNADVITAGGLTLITDVDAAIDAAGDAGTLKPALEAIALQCKPIIVLSHVEDDADPAALEASIIGGVENGKYFGIKAFEAAKSKFGVTPRIIGAPGFESEQVVAQLVATAQAVRGFTYAAAPVDNKEDAKAFRDLFGARELMVIWPDGTAGDESVLTAAYALGMRAKIDEETGWHKTLSNVPVNGLLGIEFDVTWDLQNPNTDAGYLNANEVSTIINESGFRFWGDRTCSANPLFAFENYTRTAQVIRDSIAEAHLYAISKGITAVSASNIVESVNRKLRQWKTEGRILGGKCWIRQDANGVDQVKDGKLVVDYDYTPIPPLEHLQFAQRITDTYIEDLVAAISA